MKKLILILGAVLICGIAQAGQVNCTGDYMGYRFSLRGTVVGSRVPGSLKISVVGPGVSRSGTMQVISSDIQAGRSIHINATGREASGSVAASFNRGSGHYDGTLHASLTSGGTIDTAISCSLSGRTMLEEQMILERERTAIGKD